MSDDVGEGDIVNVHVDTVNRVVGEIDDVVGVDEDDGDVVVMETHR